MPEDFKEIICELKVDISQIKAMLNERCHNRQDQIYKNTADIDAAFKMIRRHERLVYKAMGGLAVLSLFVVPVIQRYIGFLLGR